MSDSKIINSDICIIGAGLAGLAAATFAANRGLSCVEVGQTGEINFASGLLDLLGVYPPGEKHLWTDPWTGLDALVRDIPQHPYARLPGEDIRTAFEEILTFLYFQIPKVQISILNLHHHLPYSSVPSHQALPHACPTIIPTPIKESGEVTKAMQFLNTGEKVLR